MSDSNSNRHRSKAMALSLIRTITLSPTDPGTADLISLSAPKALYRSFLARRLRYSRKVLSVKWKRLEEAVSIVSKQSLVEPLFVTLRTAASPQLLTSRSVLEARHNFVSGSTTSKWHHQHPCIVHTSIAHSRRALAHRFNSRKL